MAGVTYHLSAAKEHLSTASNVITIITFVFGVLTLLWWWLNGIPGEIDMFQQEANEMIKELEQFRRYWNDLKELEPDFATEKVAQRMVRKIEQIVKILKGALGSGDSRNRLTSLKDKIVATFRKSRARLSSNTPTAVPELGSGNSRSRWQSFKDKVAKTFREASIRLSFNASTDLPDQDTTEQDASDQDTPEQDASEQIAPGQIAPEQSEDGATSKPRDKWVWFWYSQELQSRVAHARNLKYQLMFSYLHLLVKKDIGLDVEESSDDGLGDDANAISAGQADHQQASSPPANTHERQDRDLVDPFANGAALEAGHGGNANAGLASQ